MEEKYEVRITIRDGQGQTADDYYAKVKRRSDGIELVWISWSLRILKWKVRRGALDRAFKYYDKRQALLAEVEEFSR